MTSKYFVPHKEDLEFEHVYGLFPCQDEDCDHDASSAKWFKNANLLAWECKHGHINKVTASDYV